MRYITDLDTGLKLRPIFSKSEIICIHWIHVNSFQEAERNLRHKWGNVWRRFFLRWQPHANVNSQYLSRTFGQSCGTNKDNLNEMHPFFFSKEMKNKQNNNSWIMVVFFLFEDLSMNQNHLSAILHHGAVFNIVPNSVWHVSFSKVSAVWNLCFPYRFICICGTLTRTLTHTLKILPQKRPLSWMLIDNRNESISRTIHHIQKKQQQQEQNDLQKIIDNCRGV